MKHGRHLALLFAGGCGTGMVAPTGPAPNEGEVVVFMEDGADVETAETAHEPPELPACPDAGDVDAGPCVER